MKRFKFDSRASEFSSNYNFGGKYEQSYERLHTQEMGLKQKC